MLKIANIIIPLITLPYLVRVLGVANFGLISFAQVFMLFFLVFIDFGFDLSMTREISLYSDNLNKVSEIVSIIFVIKVVMLFFAFLIYYFIVSHFDKFIMHKQFYLEMFCVVVGQGLFPTWYFQGMQKMKFIAILNFMLRFITLILIFIFIKNMQDLNKYPIILATGYIIVLPAILYIVKKEFKYTFYKPTINGIKYYLRYSSHFFISRVAVRFYSYGGLFILGLISSEIIVGYYAMADKLKSAIISLYDPFAQVLYPYISKYNNISLYKKLFVIINILNILGLMIVYFYAAQIINFVFGENNSLSIELLRIFILLMLIDVPSILIGYPLLGALGYTNYVNYSTVLTAVVFFVSVAIFYFYNMLTAKTIAYIYVSTILFELSIRSYGVIKYKLLLENKYE